MPTTPFIGMPGVKSLRSATPRRIFLTDEGRVYLPSIQSIDGTLSRDPGNTGDLPVLRPGLLMGKVTSSGKYAPAILGVTTNAEAIGSTSIEASAAVVTELVRRVGSSGTFTLRGPASANGVIDSQTVTYSAASGTAITCTALTKAFIAGSFIQPTDGSDTPKTFIPDGHGIKCTDEDEASVDREFGPLPVKGIIDSSQLLPVWPSDTALQNWIKSFFVGQFVFDDEY